MRPGGPTDRIMQSGGQALYRDLQLLLAGHPVDRGLVALTTAFASVLLMAAETPEELERLANAFAADALNTARLNWDSPERKRARLAMLRGDRPGVQ